MSDGADVGRGSDAETTGGGRAVVGLARAEVERSPGLRIAHLHLRTGALALARAELETAAGVGTLDLAGLLDLAEVRWRTGDLAGAGEAAGAYLASTGGEDDVLACVIGAEAAAAFGRPDEAKRLSARALELASVPLDTVFAGLPKRATWPAETLELHVPAHAVVVHPDAMAPESPETEHPGLWDGNAIATGPATPDPEGQIAAGRIALAAGDHDRAALHFGVALRLAPALAPTVLDAVGDGVGPDLTLVRGDALRLVGQEWEARRAFVAAAAALHASAVVAGRPAGPPVAASRSDDRPSLEETPS